MCETQAHLNIILHPSYIKEREIVHTAEVQRDQCAREELDIYKTAKKHSE